MALDNWGEEMKAFVTAQKLSQGRKKIKFSNVFEVKPNLPSRLNKAESCQQVEIQKRNSLDTKDQGNESLEGGPELLLGNRQMYYIKTLGNKINKSLLMK